MLLRYFALLEQDPIGWAGLLLTTVIGVVSAVTIHEASHAWSALRLGDRTAALLGRVTLNPRAHLDPMGSLLFLVAFVGWGKPTPVKPENLKGNPDTGVALVSLAGPLSNIAFALILGLPIRIGLIDWRPPFQTVPFHGNGTIDNIADIVAYAILFNILLAVFNLLPLPPLDGFKVALWALPRTLRNLLKSLERYGPIPLVVLVSLEYISPFGVFSRVLIPLAKLLETIVLGQQFQ